MFKILCVGFGGMIGAMLRYSFYFLPLPYIKTIYINIIGAIIIGFVSYYSKNIANLNPKLLLFLTTGICGGFTTFSTFSLETVQMIEQNKILEAIIYVLISVTLSLIGICVGYYLAKLIKKSQLQIFKKIFCNWLSFSVKFIWTKTYRKD